MHFAVPCNKHFSVLIFQECMQRPGRFRVRCCYRPISERRMVCKPLKKIFSFGFSEALQSQLHWWAFNIWIVDKLFSIHWLLSTKKRNFQNKYFNKLKEKRVETVTFTRCLEIHLFSSIKVGYYNFADFKTLFVKIRKRSLVFNKFQCRIILQVSKAVLSVVCESTTFNSETWR